jgi:hypothetical protein
LSSELDHAGEIVLIAVLLSGWYGFTTSGTVGSKREKQAVKVTRLRV